MSPIELRDQADRHEESGDKYFDQGDTKLARRYWRWAKKLRKEAKEKS